MTFIRSTQETPGRKDLDANNSGTHGGIMWNHFNYQLVGFYQTKVIVFYATSRDPLSGEATEDSQYEC